MADSEDDDLVFNNDFNQPQQVEVALQDGADEDGEEPPELKPPSVVDITHACIRVVS